ncbi:MAG: ABC transporter substrate-binding protein [Pseudomonadota bacterium]
MNLPRRIVVPLIIVVISLMAVGIAIWTTRSQAPKFSGPPEKLILGTCPLELSSLIWVAGDRGYFAENGLDVTIEEYESGFAAMKDLVTDRLGIVTVAEFVFVGKSFERQDLRILAVIDQWDTTKVVARKDSGISQLSDLKDKRIGLVRGSTAEFCLARSLAFESIPLGDVRIVDLSPSQQTEAIKNSEIDAAIVWEPHVQKMKDALGANAVSLPGQSGQDLYWILVCKDDLIRKRPEVIHRFLSALLAAERFVTANQADAKAIVARRLNFESRFFESLWKKNSFRVTLPQALILTMEDQARWMMSAGLTKRAEIPDFLDPIYWDGLKSLKPDAISIIHQEDDR